MPQQPEWGILREYTSLDKQFVTLRRILKLGDAGKYHSKSWDPHEITFSVQLPSQLGLLIPRINQNDREVVLTCERGGARGTETFDIAKVVFFPKVQRTEVLISSVIRDEKDLMEVLRDVCERPLWYLVANCGTRGACVFCPKPLTHQSSRNVGYGPDCAKQLRLYYKYDGPETKRMSSFGVPDDFDYDSL